MVHMPAQSAVKRTLVLLCLATCAATAYEEYTFEGYGFYYYKDSYNDSTGCHSRDGIWRVDLVTGEEEQIFGNNSGRYLIEKCALSYHGKQLIFSGISIGNGIVNNDGSGYKKLPATLPLVMYPPGNDIFWPKFGYYTVHGERLRRYDVHTGEYEELDFPPLMDGGVNIPHYCYASGDGTRVWTRAGQPILSWGPKNYNPPKSQTYYSMDEQGRPARMFSRNFWGHGETITLDGSHMLFQNFAHNGMWVVRFRDGQHIGDIRYRKLPDFEPDYGTVCIDDGRVTPQGDNIKSITNSNVWVYMYYRPHIIGHPQLYSAEHRCFMQSVWNWRTNERIKIRGPEDGAWMPRCRSHTAVQCAGIWKGYDLPAVDESSAFLVPYRENVTFYTARKQSPMRKEVGIGNIDDAALEGVSAAVEPQSATVWLEAAAEKTTNSLITVTLNVEPAALTEEHQSAEVTISAESARNSVSFSVHTDNTMLPPPENFVVFHVNTSDSFAYPELTWDDVAEGEDGYYVEFFTPHDWNNEWDVIDTLGPDRTRYVSPFSDYTDETRDAAYRIRTFTEDGLYSPYSDEGGFGVPPDSLVPPPQERILPVWEAGDPSAARPRKTFTHAGPPARAPSVWYSEGVLHVDPSRALFGGSVRIVLPDGRIAARRRLTGAGARVKLSLPAQGRGVFVVQIVDRVGTVRAIRRCVVAR